MDWMKLFRASLPLGVVGLIFLVITLGLVLSGDGGGDGDEEEEGPGPGTAVGLEEAGLERCVGPLPTEWGNLSVYADAAFAAIVVSGPAVIQVAIEYAQVRTGVEGAPTKRELKRIERAWRRTADAALRGGDPPAGPCQDVERLPVLGEAEVVCANEILLPLGPRSAEDHFIDVLASLRVNGSEARDICPEL
jgi:hypothetical protein